MAVEDASGANREQEALKFLERDFNQCFEQMRHYDGQVFDLLKTLLTVYSVLSGLAVGVYQVGVKENIDLRLPAALSIFVGLVFGLCMFSMVVRTRIYFVGMTRYINDQRDFFLRFKPLGFQNRSGIFTSVTQPQYFDWRSSQVWHVYIIAFLNAMMSGILVFIALDERVEWSFLSITMVVEALVMLAIQLVVAIRHWKSQEGKPSSEAVFGEPSLSGNPNG